jgi:hypothetical protein
VSGKRKEYSVKEAVSDAVSIEAYREAPWVQKWASTTFDFRRWSYVGRPKLDEQQLGEGLIHAGRDSLVEALRNAIWDISSVTDCTKCTYCGSGLRSLFEFLDSRHAIKPVTSLEQIDEVVLEEFIYWLRHIKQGKTQTGKLSEKSVLNYYEAIKAVLHHLVNQEALPADIFPANAFPNIGRAGNKHAPYPKEVMRQILKALATDIKRLREGTLKLWPKESLIIYLMAMAARSGRNPGPLMNATRDALQPHPIKKNMAILQVFKNRGNGTHIQGYRCQEEIEDVITVPMDVVTLFHEINGITAPLVRAAPAELKNQLWLYRISRGKSVGAVALLENYHHDAQRIVERHNLKDIDGKPLRLNISRLRATFTMRMWLLTGGDLFKTAALAGNVPAVTDRNYLAPTPEMESNHRRLGHVMHADLSDAINDQKKLEALSIEIGIPVEQLVHILSGKNNTGVGRCRDPLHGFKAPGDGTLCTRWLGCFTCPDQVVMESDMYRLYSFYFLLLKERNFLPRERWDEIYGPVIHIIDHEIVAPNLRTGKKPRGCFDPLRVKKMREQAEREPHPMWRTREILALGGTDA